MHRGGKVVAGSCDGEVERGLVADMQAAQHSLLRARSRQHGIAFGNGRVACGRGYRRHLEFDVDIECPRSLGRFHDDLRARVVGFGRCAIEAVVKYELVISPRVVDVVKLGDGSANRDLRF